MKIEIIYSLEPLSDEQITRIESRTQSKVECIDRAQLGNYPKLSSIEFLVCRDRDNILDVLSSCPSLKYMYIISAGVDRLPFEELKSRNIIVTHAKGINAEIICQYVMAYILSDSARVFENLENQAHCYWKKYQAVEPLITKKLLIIGTGNIGTRIGSVAKKFNIQCIGIRNSISEKLSDFDIVDTSNNIDLYISSADYIVISCPLTQLSTNMMNGDRIRHMKQGGMLINVSRAGIVDYDALIKECSKGRIRAVLDVFPEEPLLPNNPLWGVPNIIITPHSAGRMPNYKDYAINNFVENIILYLGESIIKDEVNLDKQY